MQQVFAQPAVGHFQVSQGGEHLDDTVAVIYRVAHLDLLGLDQRHFGVDYRVHQSLFDVDGCQVKVPGIHNAVVVQVAPCHFRSRNRMETIRYVVGKLRGEVKPRLAVQYRQALSQVVQVGGIDESVAVHVRPRRDVDGVQHTPQHVQVRLLDFPVAVDVPARLQLAYIPVGGEIPAPVYHVKFCLGRVDGAVHIDVQQVQVIGVHLAVQAYIALDDPGIRAYHPLDDLAVLLRVLVIPVYVVFTRDGFGQYQLVYAYRHLPGTGVRHLELHFMLRGIAVELQVDVTFRYNGRGSAKAETPAILAVDIYVEVGHRQRAA